MRKTLLYLLFAVFLAANITKWYAALGSGIRIYYSHALIAAWMVLALPFVTAGSYRLPAGIKLILLFKALWILAVVLGTPTVHEPVGAAEMATYGKAVISALLEGCGTMALVLFVVRLDPREHRKVINLYLGAVGVCLAYTLAQGWAIYRWDIDLDRLVSTHLPLWHGAIFSLDDDVFGLGSGTYYRLTGFTGDPNLNGMVFLVALPLVFFRAFERRRLLVIAVLALLLLGIVLSVSNTAILLTAPVILLLVVRYRNRSRWIKRIAGAALVAGAVLLAIRYGPEIRETLEFKTKLSADGTASSHVSLWFESLSIWRDHPLGVGANSYPRFSEEYSVHNSYLQNLVELGPLGLMASAGWSLTCVVLCWRAREGIGFATMLAVGALSVGSWGHDLLNRFEFQSILNALVAIAVLQHRAHLASAPAHAGSPASVPASQQGNPSVGTPSLH